MDIQRLKTFPFRRKEPCIITDEIKDWPALEKWSPSFFKKAFKDLKVVLNYDLPESISPYLCGAEGHTKETVLEKAMDFMAQSDRCYLAQQEMSHFPGLEKDYQITPIVPESERDKEIYTHLWIGKNTQSGLHYDYNDNFLIQIFGVKKVFLAHPKETKYLYPLPGNFTKMQVNPAKPDFKMFPKFKKATIWKGEIHPGEYLFIPRGWFHHIYAPGESISLNCWYGEEMSKQRRFLSFYRSGPKVWRQFAKDFVWHGILKRPEKVRLFCSQSLGKLAYDRFQKKFLSG